MGPLKGGPALVGSIAFAIGWQEPVKDSLEEMHCRQTKGHSMEEETNTMPFCQNGGLTLLGGPSHLGITKYLLCSNFGLISCFSMITPHQLNLVKLKRP